MASPLQPSTKRTSPNMNYINLKRALAGKTTSGGGVAMSKRQRSQIIGAAMKTIATRRDVTESEAMRILRSATKRGKSVGGFVKGAKRGINEGKATAPSSRRTGPAY